MQSNAWLWSAAGHGGFPPRGSNLKCKAQEHLSSPWARPKPKYFFSLFFPPNREYKLVPAAQYLISKNTGRAAAAAAVARDGTGAFQGASVLITQGVTDPESMEAIACREGLALASDLAIRKVRIASDNINVVKNIRGDSKGIYGHIVQEIKARAGSFASSEFVHEGRASNEDAHKLARSSVYCDLGRQVWFLSPPKDICISVPINN